MSINKEKEKSAEKKDDSEEKELEKYAVACKCVHGQRPKDVDMTKLADGTHRCPHCGRRHG